MRIKTKYHGEIEINMADIIHFENGIPGFHEEKEFLILPLSDEQTYFVMQSVVTEYLAFVITSPFYFFKEYDFQLEDSIIEELGLSSEKDVQVFSILTVGEPFENTTANLKAPIIINHSNNKAKQVILNQISYHTKHPLF